MITRVARLALIVASLTFLAVLPGCGDDDDTSSTGTTENAAAPDLDAVKSYLTDHSAALAGHTETLQQVAEDYDALAKESDYDYARMLEENRDEVVSC